MSFNKKIIIGARGSRLSLAYANYAKKLIIRNNRLNENEVDIKIIKTREIFFQRHPYLSLVEREFFARR